MNLNDTFSLPLADEKDIEEIMKRLDTSKATGIDTIPARPVKISANFTHKPLTKNLNKSILLQHFPNQMQVGKNYSNL